MHQRGFPHGRIELVVGDLVEQDCDAIVNAANTTLLGGGGVDGAIHDAAGPALLEECLKIPEYEPGRRCPTGECRVTDGAELRARHVIHAVGPFYNEKSGDKAAALLAQVHRNSLQAAVEQGCRTVAFPAISTGAYRFPLEDAAPIALTAVRDFFQTPSCVQTVRFVLFSQSVMKIFSRALAKLES